jgi:pimeloyl-ACP methyl ester carboxylesterase
MSAILEPIVGRYVQLNIDGEAQRIYFEEAGSGVPLVCLHTAGSDSRQYRHLLNDQEITSQFRVLAFDLPRHGKSNPPVGWQRQEYRLTMQSYTEAIRQFCKALELDRPVVMGCSIGGRIVLNLAFAHAEEFRALIGLQAADYQAPWFDTNWVHHPDVNGAEACAGLMSGLIAPQAPEEARWETLWHYMQGAPGVFKGDLHFYRVDGDLRGRMQQIDTSCCPLYLLTGEYDYSCTPGDTLRTANAIHGARAIIMDGLGHFPMSENPAQFRKYLLPVLDEILGPLK